MCLTKEYLGVFHLPKGSGKFPEFRWEMFIGEERVSLDTRVPSIPAPFSVRCIPHQKYKMAAQLLWLNEIVELSLEEESLVNSENDHDIPILAVVATYIRRVYENILPRYAIDEFKSHSRVTRGTIEALCREVQATGRAPQRHALETAAVEG